jgi:hypothetical protein
MPALKSNNPGECFGDRGRSGPIDYCHVRIRTLIVVL